MTTFLSIAKAAAKGVAPAQLALAWVLAQGDDIDLGRVGRQYYGFLTGSSAVS